MERRRQSLVNMGHAVRLEDGRIRVSKDFIANLERAEVTRVGKAMAAERGLTFTAAKTGEYVSGTLVGSTQLASGRFAMIDDGIGFQLVPWQPVLEKRIGQHITGIMRDAQVASNGVSAGNGGWGYECPQCRCLLVDMGPDRRHPLKAGAVQRPRFAACGLDRMSPARQGLAMLVRLGVTRFAAYHCQLQRRGNPPLASISTPQVDDWNF